MMIPVLMVRDMAQEITFLSEILDFQLVFATPEEAPLYAVLKRGADELHLNLAQQQHRPGGASFIVVVDDIDALFASFLSRRLTVPTRENSPVHEAPLDQSWGTREVYIDDPSGNTIIFQQR